MYGIYDYFPDVLTPQMYLFSFIYKQQQMTTSITTTKTASKENNPICNDGNMNDGNLSIELTVWHFIHFGCYCCSESEKRWQEAIGKSFHKLNFIRWFSPHLGGHERVKRKGQWNWHLFVFSGNFLVQSNLCT